MTLVLIAFRCARCLLRRTSGRKILGEGWVCDHCLDDGDDPA